MTERLLTYTLSVAVLTLIPGADTMLTLRNALARGRLAGIATAFGIGSGLFVQATLSGLGLAAIVVRSAQLYHTITLAGACYLAGLGIWTILTTWRQYSPIKHDRVVGQERHAFAEGLLSNVLNPKVAVFYLAFLPQFISPDDPVLLTALALTTIHFAFSVIWFSILTILVSSVSSWLRRNEVRRRLNYVTGTVLTVLGIRLAVEG
ncbi:LysE family translocator [Chloroflexus sp. Y-396-1]|uniref:LysE family translocator n=1 Tax=Chloroflexus sp. Y-396-1 TaxID=867845 RepID=UPI001E2F20FD|nr:LysE family translocator [Chloroflexus sp. Y-396-1]